MASLVKMCCMSYPFYLLAKFGLERLITCIWSIKWSHFFLCNKTSFTMSFLFLQWFWSDEEGNRKAGTSFCVFVAVLLFVAPQYSCKVNLFGWVWSYLTNKQKISFVQILEFSLFGNFIDWAYRVSFMWPCIRGPSWICY